MYLKVQFPQDFFREKSVLPGTREELKTRTREGNFPGGIKRSFMFSKGKYDYKLSPVRSLSGQELRADLSDPVDLENLAGN